MTTKTNPYTTAPTLVPDTRTPAEKLVDKMIEDGGANEQGAEYGVVERRVAVKLADHLNEMASRIEIGKEIWRQDQARIAELTTQRNELLTKITKIQAAAVTLNDAMSDCMNWPDSPGELARVTDAVKVLLEAIPSTAG